VTFTRPGRHLSSRQARRTRVRAIRSLLGCSVRAARRRIVGDTRWQPPGDERMDEQPVSYVSFWAAALCGGLALSAVAWLLASLSSETAGGVRLRASDLPVSSPVSVQRPGPDHTQRCIDATSVRGMSRCAAASSGRSAPVTSSRRPAQGPAHLHAVAATRPRTQVATPAAPASPPPASSSSPSAPPPARPHAPPPARPHAPPPARPHAPPRVPSSHHGPVPGGATSPPHPGPRP
jgi:hypothetical protein